MLLAVISALSMTTAGFVPLRLSGIQCGAVRLGLAPSVGIAVLAVVSIWTAHLAVPEAIVGVVVLGISLTGFVIALRDAIVWGTMRSLFRQRVAMAALSGSLLVGGLVLSGAVFVTAGVPDYVHDGSTHAELVDALRHGVRLAGVDWYPTGFHAPIAALLALTPSVDSAAGVVGWGLGLTLLAPLAVFGFGTCFWPDRRIAATGALVLALTSAYPYGTQLYSVWPMAAGLLLTIGLWTTSLEYLAHPSLRLALLGGLLAGAMMLTHGTEVYTVAIGLAVFAATDWRRVASWRVARDVCLALVLAVLTMVPYLPTLASWTAAGGAVTVGEGYFAFRQGLRHDDLLEESLFWTSAVSSGFLVDFPLRIALVLLGGWAAFRYRAGRSLVLLAMIFAICVGLSRYVDAAPVKAVFALTLPWGVDDRLIMIVSIVIAPLGGLGLVSVADTLAARVRTARTLSGTRISWRRMARSALVLATLLSGLASVFFVAEKFSLQTGGIVTYAADDAQAMAWLHQHAQPGDVLLNDGAADAGIWAPYKANIPIVLPRSRSVASDGPEVLLRAELGQLDTDLTVRQAACSLGVRYVFRGIANSPSEHRQFPELEELRHIRTLEEVFSSGQAAVFRTRLDCKSV